MNTKIMMPVLCLTAIIGGLAVTPSFAQETTQPPPDKARTATAEDDFARLQKRFGVLYRTFEAQRGIMQSDRPVVDSFRAEIEAFVEAHPTHAGGTAMLLTVIKWTEPESERIEALYQRLMELKPESAEIGLAWIDHRAAVGELSDDELFDAYRKLFDQYRDDPQIRVEYAKRLRSRMRYDEAAEVLRAGEIDPDENPEAVNLLADVLFADHHFAEASELIDSISDETIAEIRRTKPQVGLEITRNKTTFKEYVDLWQKEQELRASEDAADDLPRVAITTTKGLILIELLENEAPNTVANFISLAESGFYDQTKIHRYIGDFMAQGGDPNTRPGGEGSPGTGNPGYFIPDEHTKPEHRNHFGDSVSMANQSRPNTGGSQFFFNFRPTPWLNGRHTVFGKVIQGRDVVRSLRQDDEIITIEVLRKRDHDYNVADTIPVPPAPTAPAPPPPPPPPPSDG